MTEDTQRTPLAPTLSPEGAGAGERLALVLRRIAGVETRDRPPEHDLHARIDYLERDAGEMRMRVNGLFFGLIALAAGEILLRAMAG